MSAPTINRPSGPISLRLAVAADKARMLQFLADHWRADHIFVQAPALFDWQYRKPDGAYHIVLALDEAGTVLGFLGYIPTGQFDPALGCNEIMLAIWKVREDMVLPGVGLRLLKWIEKTHKPRVIGAIGISDMVEPIYSAFKYRLGELHHAALFGAGGAMGAIARAVPELALAQTSSDRLRLSDLPSDQGAVDLVAQGPGLKKSWHYLRTRYSEHPYYDYTLRGIFAGDVLQAIVIWRRVAVGDAAVLRIVDVVGPTEALAQVTHALRDAVLAAQADYIDILAGGVDVDCLRTAGFVSPIDHPDLILPNFFNPFEARNVTVKLAYRCFDIPERILALFRADSDQDRPNSLAELVKT